MVEYKAIGLMSGTSFDGLDLAYCRFRKESVWQAEIVHATTIPYSNKWVSKLSSMANQNAMGLAHDHVEYGHFLGKAVRDFMKQLELQPDFICSHGHTIFHQPDKGFTLQVGDGNAIASETCLPVICDFRSLDVALGGQGAPLVPVGDRLLFGQYDYCLNIGGIANISYELNEQRIAFDICPANMILNYLSGKMGLPYDLDGKIAASGNVDQSLLTHLNQLNYYGIKGVKTLGKEWFDENVLPALENRKLRIPDLMATAVEHIAMQIGQVLSNKKNHKILVTGGGALNKFLVQRMKEHTSTQLYIPDEQLVQFKEALIFAFLGVLRWRGEINCYASVTGASRDSSCGVIVK